MGTQRHSTLWHVGISAYWFATSFKWFVLLLMTMSYQISLIVPDGEKNQAWGQVVMIGAIWAAIGPSLFGWLSDYTHTRFGRRRLYIALGAAASLIALFTLHGAQSLAMMIVGYLLLQISDDMGTGPYSALIPESVDETERGRASGVLGIMRLTAQIFSGLLGFIFAKNITGVYVGIAVVNVLGAAWTIWTLRNVPDPAREPKKISLKSFFSAWLSPFSDFDFRVVFAITFVGNLGYYIIQTFLRNFFEDRMKSYTVFGAKIDFGFLAVTDANSAIMFLGLLISILGITGAVWATKKTDKIGRKKSVLIGGFLMSVPIVPFALVHDFSLVVVLSPIFAFGYGVYQAASWALVSDILPDPTTMGKDMGVWQAAWSSVQIFAGVLGFAIDYFNRLSGNGLGYTVAFLIGTALLLGGAMLTKKVRGSS